ncbi:c-type cytochrome [Marinobacter sp. S0848L]|uniref:c-type cytochrome n=1 Tax=Marinobacter sp. S0848L TaxID=2926423 RepID=UPI001FF38F2A|nr:c-type cytochrome [Marinobacter sp. S0848L]MCK0106672.1 c-type cytochrome [Marinobacter sp. S0848L]
MMRFNCSLTSALWAIFALLAITLSTACTNTSPPSEEVIEYARSATPDNPETAEIYQRSCMACHGNGTSDAPLTGDQTAWQPRMEKGMDTLLNNVVSGMGGMPPYGLCMDCNAADFQALITFMATSAQN